MTGEENLQNELVERVLQKIFSKSDLEKIFAEEGFKDANVDREFLNKLTANLVKKVFPEIDLTNPTAEEIIKASEIFSKRYKQNS